MFHFFLALSLLLVGCTAAPAGAAGPDDTATSSPPPANDPSPEFKAYWYAGDAELTSYRLKQARYGEMRDGNAVLVFVTEPFSTSSWTKADNPGPQDASVLKLNFHKTFNTGIYPYSMLNGTFFPVSGGDHSLKISSSSQEWCGHTFMELKNEDQYNISINSYFEGESGESQLSKDWLEDDFWSLLRIDPARLPVGRAAVIPSFFYLRLLHQETKAYTCELTKGDINDTLASYTITYPELDRTLTIRYEKAFPYRIDSWEETYFSGFGSSRTKLTTTAERINSLKTAYWTKNKNADLPLRDSLGLR